MSPPRVVLQDPNGAACRSEDNQSRRSGIRHAFLSRQHDELVKHGQPLRDLLSDLYCCCQES